MTVSRRIKAFLDITEACRKIAVAALVSEGLTREAAERRYWESRRKEAEERWERKSAFRFRLKRRRHGNLP